MNMFETLWQIIKEIPTVLKFILLMMAIIWNLSLISDRNKMDSPNYGIRYPPDYADTRVTRQISGKFSKYRYRVVEDHEIPELPFLVGSLIVLVGLTGLLVYDKRDRIKYDYARFKKMYQEEKEIYDRNKEDQA